MEFVTHFCSIKQSTVQRLCCCVTEDETVTYIEMWKVAGAEVNKR